MLVAKLNDQIVIADQSINRELTYYCPICDELVIFKCGQIKLPYFAHQKDSDCASSEGETSEHLLGKRQIFEWAKQKGYCPRYEVYLSEIKQRPDILIEISGVKIAIEFQCSPLSDARLTERNQGYRKLKIRYFWILGAPYRRKLQPAKIAQFTQLINYHLCIVYWNTQTAQFEFNDSFKAVELITKTKKLSLIENQIETINHKMHIKSDDIKQIAEHCYVQHRDVRLIPLVAHFQQASWPLMSINRTFFQVEVLLRLEKNELNMRWTKAQWLRWLNEIANDNWLSFSCIENIKLIRRKYLVEFTNQLINETILSFEAGFIYLRHYPIWFKSEYEKRVNKNVSNRKR